MLGHFFLEISIRCIYIWQYSLFCVKFGTNLVPTSMSRHRFRRSSCLEKMAQRKWKHCNQSLVPCLIAGNLVLQLIFVKVSIAYLRGYLLCFGRTLVISISASSKFWRKTPVFIVVKSRFQWMSFNHISLNANEIKRERNKTWILLYDTSLLTCNNQNTLKITEYGFLICLCFFTKFFSIILFFFYFFFA